MTATTSTVNSPAATKATAETERPGLGTWLIVAVVVVAFAYFVTWTIRTQSGTLPGLVGAAYPLALVGVGFLATWAARYIAASRVGAALSVMATLVLLAAVGVVIL